MKTKHGELSVDPAKAAAYRSKINEGRSPAYAAATTLVRLDKDDRVPNRIAALEEAGVLQAVLIEAGVVDEKPKKVKGKPAPAHEEPAPPAKKS